MTDKSNTEMLLPQAGIPGYIPQPKKNASEDVIGEYKKQVQQLGDKGLKEDKTGLSAKLTYIVALAWAFFFFYFVCIFILSVLSECVCVCVCQSLPLGFCTCSDLSQPSDT